MPPEHWRFLQATVDWHETASHIFIHAPIRADVPVDRQTLEDWRRAFDLPDSAHCSGKTVECGHSSQRGGLPLFLNGMFFVDTWAYAGQWLSALHLETGGAIQASQEGSTGSSPAAPLHASLPEPQLRTARMVTTTAREPATFLGSEYRRTQDQPQPPPLPLPPQGGRVGEGVGEVLRTNPNRRRRLRARDIPVRDSSRRGDARRPPADSRPPATAPSSATERDRSWVKLPAG